MTCDHCSCDDIQDFLCSYSCYEEMQAEDCSGNETTIPNVSYADISSREVECSCGCFRIKDRVFRIHISEASSPPAFLTDSSGSRWTVIDSSYRDALCRWRIVARCVAVDAGLCQELDVCELSEGRSGCGTSIQVLDTVSTVPGLIRCLEGFESNTEDRRGWQSFYEVTLDPKDFEACRDWSKVVFKDESKYPGMQFRVASISDPKCGDPLVLRARREECQIQA